jgi:hypothetical protein
MALVYDGGLARIQPLKLQTYAVYAQYTEFAEYNLVSGDLCIPPALKHIHIRASSRVSHCID